MEGLNQSWSKLNMNCKWLSGNDVSAIERKAMYGFIEITTKMACALTPASAAMCAAP